MKRQSFILAVFIILQLAACNNDSKSSNPTSQCHGEHWVGAWAAAPSDAEASYSNQTLRLVLTPLRGGDEVRVLFSNRLSEQPLRISNAYLGKQDSGPALIAGTNTPLYFGGQTEVTISPGREIYCDSVEFSFEAFEKLAVSLYLPGEATGVTKHDEAHQTSYVSETGFAVHAADENGNGLTLEITKRPIVMGLDVTAPAGHSVVIAIGDSITDGSGSGPPDTDHRYPDFLARRLLDKDESLSVINLGIGGNRILQDGVIPSMGFSLLSRLDKDVLIRQDVSNLILLEGINDLGISPDVSAEELIAGLEEAVEIIRTSRVGFSPIKVFVGTILPAGSTEGVLGYAYQQTEERRHAINEYIRSNGIGDGYIDFDKALRDTEDPTILKEEYDSGDGLHPSAEGYEQMALKVNLSELQNRDCSYAGAK